MLTATLSFNTGWWPRPPACRTSPGRRSSYVSVHYQPQIVFHHKQLYCTAEPTRVSQFCHCPELTEPATRGRAGRCGRGGSVGRLADWSLAVPAAAAAGSAARPPHHRTATTRPGDSHDTSHHITLHTAYQTISHHNTGLSGPGLPPNKCFVSTTTFHHSRWSCKVTEPRARMFYVIPYKIICSSDSAYFLR